MILKHWGSLGDERIPSPFRGKEFDVFAKDGIIGWVVLAISRDNNCQTPRWSYPQRTQWGNQQGGFVSGEFHRRLMDKTGFSGKISDLSLYEIDDIFEQAYSFIVSHHDGEWSRLFPDDNICSRLIGLLRRHLTRLRRWIQRIIYIKCGIKSGEVECGEHLVKETTKQITNRMK